MPVLNLTSLSLCLFLYRFEYPSPYWDAVSDDAKDLINHLLVVDPKKRYKCEDVAQVRFQRLKIRNQKIKCS